MRRQYAIVSGELPDLARAEVESIVHTYDPSADTSWCGRLCLINSKIDVTVPLLHRAAFLQVTGRIFEEADRPEDLRLVTLSEFLGNARSFALRGFIVSQPRSSGRELAVEVGAVVKRNTGLRVNLDSPDLPLLAIDCNGTLLLGDLQRSVTRREVMLRKSRKRPFFHPSIMNAPLARAMCNLARLLPGNVVLDPFCGAGGILCEAADLGARVIGLEINWKLLQGARANLSDTGGVDFSLIQGDARQIPLAQCDSIVTDPPYGRVSSTRGEHARLLVDSLLSQLSSLLRAGGRMCLCTDSRMRAEEMIRRHALSIEVQVEVRVHAALTREIFVVQHH